MSNSIRIRITATLAIFALLSIPILNTLPYVIQNIGFESIILRKCLVLNLLILTTFFVNHYYLLPRFFFNKQEIKYFIFVCVIGLLVLILPNLIIGNSSNAEAFDLETTTIDFDPMRFGVIQAVGSFLLVVALSLFLKMSQQVLVIPKIEKQSAISPIQSQVSPHFLFNTLNSLYALTIAKNDSAPDVVIKLSNMLRYIVAESANDRVPLKLELDYITNYISVQRLRIAEENKLEMTVSGDPTNQVIRPTILIPFIENAFKYGVNEAENWQINILIEIVKDVFNMKIMYNKLLNHLPKQSFDDAEIEVAKERLALAYPNAHSLKLENLPDAYQIALQINLI